MAYPEDIIRVSVLWKPTGAGRWGGEEAVTTFHLKPNLHPPQSFTWSDEMAWLPEQLANKYEAHAGDFLWAISNDAEIVQFKCAHLEAATGHVLDEGAYDVPSGVLQGIATTGMMPPEVAVAVSAWSYLPGGFASNKGRKRGRFYLPYVAKGLVETDGTIKESSATDLANGFKNLFNDIQGMHTHEAGGIDPDYFDFITVSKVDATWHNVDWVSVDTHFDSQRRRQHQAPPVRFVQPIAH